MPRPEECNVCGKTTELRYYLPGWRCHEHSPATLSGRTVPAPDPQRTVAGMTGARAPRPANVRALRAPVSSPDTRTESADARVLRLDARPDGATVTESDVVRLRGQALRVHTLMRDGQWRTLAAMSKATGDPEASVQARLRDFRKPQFGSMTVDTRRLSEHGPWEYRLVPESIPASLAG